MRKGNLLKDLVVAARYGYWDWVDANIGRGCSPADFLKWAREEGLQDESENAKERENIRKLARRILDKEV